MKNVTHEYIFGITRIYISRGGRQMIKKIREEIFDYFPDGIRNENFITDEMVEHAEEIRIRIGQPICIRQHQKEYFLQQTIRVEDLRKLLENFANNSIYSVQEEINCGFLTIKGGHRIGITGTCVLENGSIKNIKYISSLNIRVAREVKHCADEILPHILENRRFENTLILSPPGCGKTTMIRDMVRQLSDGSAYCLPYQIGLVDERSEIAAMYKGVPQNDIGKRTDVMNQCQKALGMRMLIRSMGPQIIATDEIGGETDWNAVMEAMYSGVKVLLTAHGEELQDISPRFLDAKVFKHIAILKKEKRPGELAKLYLLEGNRYVSCL